MVEIDPRSHLCTQKSENEGAKQRSAQNLRGRGHRHHVEDRGAQSEESCPRASRSERGQDHGPQRASICPPRSAEGDENGQGRAQGEEDVSEGQERCVVTRRHLAAARSKRLAQVIPVSRVKSK